MKDLFTNKLIVRTAATYLMVAVFFSGVPIAHAAISADIKANGSDGPVTITVGDSWNYSWNSVDATACVLTAPITGDSGISVSGSGGPIEPGHPWYPATGGSTTLTLNCTDGTNSSTDSVTINVIAVIPPALVTADIKANGSDGPITVAGESFVYSWDSTGATACVLTSPTGDSGISINGAGGPIDSAHPWYPAPGGSTTLTLNCTNGTNSGSNSVVINRNVLPSLVTADIKANGSDGPITVAGESFVYSWSSTGATACVLTSPTGDSGISISGSGGPIDSSHPWYPAAGGSTTLTLNCTNGTNSGTDFVVINRGIVPPTPVTADIKANGSDGPVVITAGSSWTYSWDSTGATACVLTSPTGDSGISINGSGGPIAPTHPWYPSIGSPTTLTLNCTNGTNSDSDSVVISLAPAPTVVTADIKANGVDGPVTVHGEDWVYSWTSNNATACVLTSPTGDSGISIAGSGGPISNTHPWYPTVGGPTTLTLNCTDGTSSATDFVVINLVSSPVCPLPVITSPLTATGTVGQPFTYTITSTTPGAPATSTVASVPLSSLPPGLSFTISVISGTPLTAGTFTVPMTVTNDCGPDTEDLVIVISPIPGGSCPVPPGPTITSPLTASGNVGQFFTYTITATTSSATTTSFSIGGSTLPAALSFSTSTATISGTLITPGTFNVTLIATTDCGSDAETLVITITNPTSCPLLPIITSSLTASVDNGDAFSYTITATNATSISVGTLPSWLTYSSSTQTISGRPHGGATYNVDIIATNSCGTATATLVITVVDHTGGGGGGDRVIPPVPGEVLGATNFCPFLTSYLRMGYNNDPFQVMKLQAFLKGFEGYDYVTINGVFDQATFQAVSAFQLKYSSEVLAPWGISAPTGYVYITTLGKINKILCGSGIPGVPKYIKVTHDKEMGGYDKEMGGKENAGSSTAASLPLIGNNVDKGQNKNIQSHRGVLAITLFSWPDTGLETMQCIYELLLILVVLYILGKILENVLYKDTPENVLKKHYTKWGTMTTGTLIALAGAYFLEEWCLLLPLIIAFVLSLGLMLSRSKHAALKARAESWYVAGTERAKSIIKKGGKTEIREENKTIILPGSKS